MLLFKYCMFSLLQSEVKEDNQSWASAMLLAILFNHNINHDIMQSIPVLTSFLRSEEVNGRYFSAQAINSLVNNSSQGTTALLTVANSGAVIGLIPLLGCAETDISHLLDLAQEFSLEPNPELTALRRLFSVDEIRVGPAARKAIPVLVDLLKPIPDRPGAPLLALRLLTQLTVDSLSNVVLMVESGALEALTKYLSLSPQDATEEAATDLLGIFFSSAEICRHESAAYTVSQLIAVLRLGNRNSRYSAAKALESLFSADHIRNAEPSRQAIQPLVEILSSGLEREQHAAVGALISLLSGSTLRATTEFELGAVDVLCKILAGNFAPELKGGAAELCCVLFSNARLRSSAAAARCVEPLVSLLVEGSSPALLSVVKALEKLLEDEQLAEIVANFGTIVPLVGLLSGQGEPVLHEAVGRALVKIGRDRPASKIDMVKAGVIESALNLLLDSPSFLASAMAELLRILTNNASVAKSPAAGKLVGPLFGLLTRPEVGPDGLQSALQALVNILEHPQCRAECTSLSSHMAMEPVISLLDSSVPSVQQLAAELLSHLLAEEHLQKDGITAQAISPLVQSLGSGRPATQHRAIKALSSLAHTWPNAIAKEGGVYELCKVIMQSDPSLPQTLWESASSVLSTILQFSSEFYLEVPVAVLVKLLKSSNEGTVTGALNALLVLDSDDSTSAEAMAESGAIEALLDLLRSHQCEENSARLLEALLNNMKIRETKVAKAAIGPLSLYLLDPQTQSQQGRLLSALALGDLFQNEGLARTPDAVSACRALVNLLEDSPTEEMKVVAICALQNLVMCNRANKRAVAEAGGVQVVLDLISSSDPDTSVQAAMFIKLLFSGLSIQEYASSETVRAITGEEHF